MNSEYDAPTQLYPNWSGDSALGDEPILLPVLIIACHPDANRLGEYAVLDSLWQHGSQELSRHWPEFINPQDSFGKGLSIAHISRKSLLLERSGAMQIKLSRQQYSAPVRVDGKALQDSLLVGKKELQQGVQLCLSERVLLILKYIPVPALHNNSYGLLGLSQDIEAVRERIRKVDGLNEPVLIRGATGTGKELVAQAIYQNSARVGKPFISVNLAALQESLAAAELFGARKGSYTGAVQERQGYFQAANGGTLFLDEIGEASVEVQTMLLRVLETGDVMPVGANQSEKVDVRIIAATDANLEKLGETDAFKLPLLHRLSSYQIFLSPLKERCEDIPCLLLHFFLQQWEQVEKQQGAVRLPTDDDIPWLSPDLVSVLLSCDWPGNIRQLRNVARQLVIDGRGQKQLRLDAQLRDMLHNQVETPGVAESRGQYKGSEVSVKRKPSQVSREELAQGLRQHRFDLQATADHLGIARASVYKLIERHPEMRQVADISDEELIASYEKHAGDLEKMMWQLEVSQLGLRRRLRAMGFDA
ncbi:sigma-54-dependent Fis family transcriptional regulator [Aliidiomarina minuta]|uniref:Sigma-54-dependent Fis family transcriptional regulator n=1 Tax=Aliidiomarina minuta TaxID=880057 RepID=A0A432W4H0_9GAMM|nr:sigma 54-interacting transcriptional regulator [Aliidiomarina minuta]RUO24402.1 sigma-54-dependent Fis family transcriptional regulator [Aliidiomarina minuta]